MCFRFHPAAAAAPVLLALVGLIAPIAHAQSQTGGRVVSLIGTAMAKPPEGVYHPLRVNDGIPVGYEVMTGENSEVVIQTAWGSTVRVFPDSRLIYDEPSGGLRGLIELFLGSVKVKVERLSGRPNPHKMTTPTAVIAVRGTTFSVIVDEESTTLVAVEEGLVSVANRANPTAEVLLRRGERTWVRRGLMPERVQRFRGPSERADLVPRVVGRPAEAVRMPATRGPQGRERPTPAGGPPVGAPGMRQRPDVGIGAR
ncbi:MAG: FecR domain-containing protein [Bryobacteraceae bacterium]